MSAKINPGGIAKTAAKVLLVWVPLSVFGLVFMLMAALPLVLSPGRVESIAVSAFRAASNGELTLSVKRFNPYTGFDIHNLVIYNGEEFGRTKFVEVERLVLDYGFFGMLVETCVSERSASTVPVISYGKERRLERGASHEGRGREAGG